VATLVKKISHEKFHNLILAVILAQTVNSGLIPSIFCQDSSQIKKKIKAEKKLSSSIQSICLSLEKGKEPKQCK
jgi:hypothetical protein